MSLHEILNRSRREVSFSPYIQAIKALCQHFNLSLTQARALTDELIKEVGLKNKSNEDQ